MTQAVQIFNNPEFGDVRIVDNNGESLFIGRDVAIALGYSNPRDALAKHVPDKYKKDGVAIIDSMGREQAPTLITKAGLYKLVMHSNFPFAEQFTDLLCETILAKHDTDEADKFLKKLFTIRKNNRATDCDTYVYVLLMENQRVKIGISGKVKSRIRAISTASGLKVLNRWQTATAIPYKKALEIERCLHEKFAANRTHGEFFQINFDEACAQAEHEYEERQLELFEEARQ